MRKLSIFLLLFFCIANKIFSQQPSKSSSEFSEKNVFVIGIPDMKKIQLDLIKSDVLNKSQIISARLVFGDKLLFVYTDPQTTIPYSEIENILLQYFSSSQLFPKTITTLAELESDFQKTDKIILK